MTDKTKEALVHYEAALKEAFPSGATGDVFHHWNEARKALVEESSGTEQPDMNLNCKSVQARLATSWGYVKAEQPAQQQEPVRHEFQTKDGKWHPFIDEAHYHNTVKDGRWPVRALYTSPPASKPWVELTEEERQTIFEEQRPYIGPMFRAIEAKLKEKNA